MPKSWQEAKQMKLRVILMLQKYVSACLHLELTTLLPPPLLGA